MEIQMDDYHKKYYTKEGFDALINRLKTLKALYDKQEQYPVMFRMVGFTNLVLYSKQDLLGRIHELEEILVAKVKGENNG